MSEVQTATAGAPVLGVTAPGEALHAHAPVVGGNYGRRDYWLRRFLAIGDTAAVLVALGVVGLATGRNGFDLMFWAVPMVPVWLVIFKLYGLYDRDIKRVSHTTVDDLPSLFHAMLLGSLVQWAYFKVATPDKLALSQVLIFAAASVAGIAGGRSAIRRASRKMLGSERVLIVGDRESLNLCSKIRTHPEYGLEPVGVVLPDGGPEDLPNLMDIAEFGRLDLQGAVDRHGVDRLLLGRTDFGEEELSDLLRESQRLGLKVSVVPQLFDVMGPSVEVDDIEGLTVLGINPPILPRSSRLLKRGLDVGISGILLLVFAPLFVLVAAAIKLDSRGPVFFRQERIGRSGRRFRVLKFRTMVLDAEERKEKLLERSEDPNWLKLDHDPRITRVGRILRLSSLDELPQLFNVVRGQMSLVGPRPLIESEDRLVGGWARSRLDLTPGVTGLWQVLGRTSIPFAEMVKLDYLYVTNWSLWTDVRLILRTLPAVLTRRGAN